MDVKIEVWTVSKLMRNLPKINKQPEYQRGAVWSDAKSALLIDSMLRGIDIPKVYLRKLSTGAYKYEVADGQQRINAISAYFNDELKLLSKTINGLDISKISGSKVGGSKFSELPKELRESFKDYKVTISVLNNATPDETRVLFGRLQEGSPLNPAEKRNAILSPVGREIDNFVLNHNFFEHSRIPAARYKRQDYLAHAIALCCYQNTKDLKADLLMHLYLDATLKITPEFQGKIAKILDKMRTIDSHSNHRISRKFNFIDIFWYLFKNYLSIDEVNSKTFAEIFDQTERLRLENNSNPEELLLGADPDGLNKSLYNYVSAFRYNGALTESISKRNQFYTLRQSESKKK